MFKTEVSVSGSRFLVLAAICESKDSFLGFGFRFLNTNLVKKKKKKPDKHSKIQPWTSHCSYLFKLFWEFQSAVPFCECLLESAGEQQVKGFVTIQITIPWMCRSFENACKSVCRDFSQRLEPPAGSSWYLQSGPDRKRNSWHLIIPEYLFIHKWQICL